MNREEAKVILSAWRPDRDSAEGDALFEQALACMESDPELAEWFAAQQADDDRVREALRGIEPPAHLREAILSEAKVVPMASPATRRMSLAWACVAAAAVFLVAAVVFFPRGGSVEAVALQSALVGITEEHEHSFASKAGDLDEVRAWLAANGGAEGFTVPAGLKNHGAVGCEVTSVEGAKVSILCFHLGGGRTAHLYVVDRSRLASPPAQGAPAMSQIGDFAMASWSEGDRSYFLAQRGDEDSLRRLL